MKKTLPKEGQDSQDLSRHGRSFMDGFRWPGLTPGAREIEKLAQDLPKRLDVFYYKLSMETLWIVFTGGTGTGKSTLFNAFCGKRLSETGMERPKTFGPIIYAYKDWPVERDFPIPSVKIERRALGDLDPGPVSGSPGRLIVLEHDLEEWSHLIVADTPDLDSVEVKNRQIAEDLYLLSDLVVFVTSEEKYADDVPYRFLQKIVSEGKPYFLLLNKAQGRLTSREVTQTLSNHRISVNQDRLWLIPRASSDPFSSISKDPSFRNFKDQLTRLLSTKGLKKFHETECSRRAGDLKNRLSRLLSLLKEENQAAEAWKKRLEALYQKACQDLLEEQKARFAAESREHLQKEIRKLFAKYDVLSKPRRILRDIILAPFKILSLGRERIPGSSQEALLKIQEKINLSPVQAVLEKFNRLVLEELSPADNAAPLFKRLRQPDVILTDQEIKERIGQEQEKVVVWLEETFEDLSKGIPKTKEWGIYSTSVLWGVLILSLETVLGGGFSIIDAALDSALAPVVTRGAVELFAYNEIRKIAHELAERYQEGFLAVVRHQRDRYEECLQSQVTTPEALKSIEEVRREIEKLEKEVKA